MRFPLCKVLYPDIRWNKSSTLNGILFSIIVVTTRVLIAIESIIMNLSPPELVFRESLNIELCREIACSSVVFLICSALCALLIGIRSSQLPDKSEYVAGDEPYFSNTTMYNYTFDENGYVTNCTITNRDNSGKNNMLVYTFTWQ